VCADYCIQLEHLWLFDQNFNDSIGGAPCTPYGDVRLGEGKLGKAAVFDGATAGLDVGTFDNFGFELTVSAWVKVLHHMGVYVCDVMENGWDCLCVVCCVCVVCVLCVCCV